MFIYLHHLFISIMKLHSLLSLIFLVISLDTADAKDTLRVGYTPAAPFITIDNEQQQGISYWLWDKIAKNLDVEYELVNLEFKEVLKGLEEGTIDLSINPLTVTSERNRNMLFTHPFFVSKTVIVVKESSSFHKFQHFLRSFFSTNFLQGIVILILIIGLFGVITWYFERKENPEQFRKGWKGIWDGLWWSVVTMTTVGYGDKSPKSRGGKIVALMWMFSGLLFISGFTASVASTLTVNQLHWNPTDVDLFKNSKVGTIKSSGTEAYLRTHFFKKINTYYNLTDGLDALLNDELTAFIYDEPIVKYKLDNDEHYESLEILPIQCDLQFYAFATSDKQALLNRKISQEILEYKESLEWRLLLSEYDLPEL